MKLNHQQTAYIIYAIFGIVILFLIFNTCHTKQRKDNIGYSDVIKAKDESIAILKEQRDRARQEADQKIEEERHKDSLLLSLFNANQPKYIPLNRTYEAIPRRIDNLSKDSLRSVIANY